MVDRSDPPTDLAALERRLAHVERALTDGETPVAELAEAAAGDARLADLEERVAGLADRVADAEAKLQALRGFAGGVDAVDEDVRRRADAALAKAESLERTLVEEPGLRVERVPDPDPRHADRDDTGPGQTDAGRRREGSRAEGEEARPGCVESSEERLLAARIRDAL